MYLYSKNRVLYLAGVVLVGIGALIVVFFSDSSTEVTHVNGYGAFLIIIGGFVLLSPGWINWIKH